jgi:hypothetical protein
MNAEAFRRICMSFDAWVVGFGISTLLRQLQIVQSPAAFAALGAVAVVDMWLLYRFFRVRPVALRPTAEPTMVA